MAYRSTALMTIAPYKYLISNNLDNCGNIHVESEGIINFEIMLNLLFDKIKLAFEKETGKKLDNVSIEFIHSPLPYASILNCLGDYTISFSDGMKKLLYAFSFLCVIGYQYSCFLHLNPENSKAWEILLKVFHHINELLNNFFTKKNYKFDLIAVLEDLEICFEYSLQDWSYQAHEVFEGAIQFILSHELGHIIEESDQSKVKQEEDADLIAIQILTKMSSFEREDNDSAEYLNKLLKSDLYATYKAINFTLFLFMLIDIKQEEMGVYHLCCGMKHDEHPSAEHRSNHLIFSDDFVKLSSPKFFLKWRSSLIYVFSFLKGKVTTTNTSKLKEHFSKF